MTVDLEGRVVLVTGAASGIGQATARAVKEAGGHVVACDLFERDRIAAAVSLDESDLAAMLDVCNENTVVAAVSAEIDRFRRIDGLVNSAGITGTSPISDLDLGVWNRVLAVHVTGAALVAKHVMRAMLAQGSGSIVNIGSINAVFGAAGNAPYDVAKGAVLQLTRTLAAEGGRYGVRVNTVSPGVIVTPMTNAVFAAQPGANEAMAAMHLLDRCGKPEEVARVVRFLLSDEASFVTGANIMVDGGFSAAKFMPR